jgi:hypothetical protein
MSITHSPGPLSVADMKTDHTATPWTLTTVRTSAGLCHKVGPFPWRNGKVNHACIYDDFPGCTGGTPELVANAHLIAAAPDLLEAAQRALNYIANTESEMGTTFATGDMLRAAIAKALGELQ